MEGSTKGPAVPRDIAQNYEVDRDRSPTRRPADTPLLARPLNAKKRKERLMVKEAYLDFFNITSFKKGWAKPLLHLEDVEEAFDLAAEIVVRVRRELDKQNGGKTHQLRLTDGAAREFLHQVQVRPQEDLDAFVHDLVHATFRDSKGLVEGLTEQQLDKYIADVKALREEHEKSQSADVLQNLHDTWHNTESRVNALLGAVSPASSSPLARHQFLNLHRLLRMLRSVNSELSIIEKNLSTKKPEEKEKEQEKEGDNMVISQPAEESQPAPAPKVEEKQFEEMRAATPPAPAPAPAPQVENKEEKPASSESPQPQQQEKEKETEPGAAASGSEAAATSGSDSEGRPRILPHHVPDEAMLKIRKVQEEYDSLKSNLVDISAEAEKLKLEQLSSDTDAGIRKLDQLQKRCLTLSHALMQELLTLDDMVGLGDATRPARKAQVNRIQQTLDDVDAISHKIQAMVTEVRAEEAKAKRVPKLKVMAQKAADQLKQEEEQRRKHEEEERKRAEVAAKKQKEEEEELKRKREAEEKRRQEAEEKRRQQQQLAAARQQPQEQRDEQMAEQEEEEEESSEGSEPARPVAAAQPGGRWRQLKLKPKFEVQEFGDAYSIAGYIPGMRQEDIDVSLGKNNTLEVKGCRYPTPQEEVAMRHQLQQLRRMESHGHYYPSHEEEEVALMRLGAGRYGCFAQAFSIPANADVNKLSASYEAGVLRIIIPKLALRPPRPAAPRFTQDPYAARGQRRPASFLDDRDAWW